MQLSAESEIRERMTTKRYEYAKVDVFAKRPFQGNPLAVFPDAEGMTTKEMQSIAREMNLSETTFVLPPSRGSSADFRVRIFTPDAEVPYAGHPTIGTFFVLASEGRIPLKGPMTIAMMEAKAGIMPVEIFGNRGKVGKVVTVQNKPVFWPPFKKVGLLAEALSLKVSDFVGAKAPPQLVSTGLPWLIAPVKNRRILERIAVNPQEFTEIVEGLPEGVVDVYATALDPVDKKATTHSRGFSLVSGGIVEDPATGSASGCLGAYLAERGLVGKGKGVVGMVNEQGFEIGRPSRISVEVRKSGNGQIDSVRVGGTVVEMMRGVISF